MLPKSTFSVNSSSHFPKGKQILVPTSCLVSQGSHALFTLLFFSGQPSKRVVGTMQGGDTDDDVSPDQPLEQPWSWWSWASLIT